MRKNLKVGDRIICLGESDIAYDADVYGKIGTLIEKSTSYSWVVDFDEHICGHDCNGLTRLGHGHYIDESCLELIQPKDGLMKFKNWLINKKANEKNDTQ